MKKTINKKTIMKKTINKKKILGVDIGLVNLGLVQVSVEDNKLSEVNFCKLINLTLYAECDDKNCILKHDKHIAYYMMHLFKEYKNIFSESDVIVIERQPPMGLVSIEQLIFYEYNDKCVFVSPNSMHSYFQIGSLGYELRKKSTVRISEEYLELFDDFKNNERKHDLSDAMCIILCYLNSLKEKDDKDTRDAKDIKNYSNVISKKPSYEFERFTYMGDINDFRYS